MCGGAADADTPGGVLENDKDVQAGTGQGADLEEVAGEQCVGLAAQEVGPGVALSLGRGRDAVLLQDLPDGGGGDLEAQGRELAVDPAVPPGGILAGEAQDQGADRADRGRAPAALRHAGGGMAPLEQIAVPAQSRVRLYQQQELSQFVSREAVEQVGEDYAVGVGERGPADLALGPAVGAVGQGSPLGANILEQAEDSKIIRPVARYVGSTAPVAVPAA
ncbi:hypothetical protein GCM10027074_54510 [Streptomyces deserti]